VGHEGILTDIRYTSFAIHDKEDICLLNEKPMLKVSCTSKKKGQAKICLSF
jgi:hypothetical protein